MSHYKERDITGLGEHYVNHVNAMTGEGLHSKSAIAAELAYRDQQIAELNTGVKRVNNDYEYMREAYHNNKTKLKRENDKLKKIIADAEYSKGEENTKFEIIVHNFDENGHKIQTDHAGYRRTIKEVCSMVKGTLETPETYRRVFIDSKPILFPMIIEITEILNAKKFEAQSMHLDKDYKEKPE